MKTKRIVLLQEEDDSPDAREIFEQHLKVKIRLTLKEFKEKSEKYDYSDGVERYYKDYVLSIYADDPFYKLEQIVEDTYQCSCRIRDNFPCKFCIDKSHNQIVEDTPNG